MQTNSIFYALQYLGGLRWSGKPGVEMRDILKFFERERSETTQT